MSLLNRIPFGNSENTLNAKQFSGSVGTQSAIKKKALADVGNTLHQKSAQSAIKFSGSAVKGKDLFESNDCSKISTMQEKRVKEEPATKVAEDLEEEMEKEEEVCMCSFDDVEDDYESDFMFKNIRLTNSQITNLALEWGGKPAKLSSRDKRICDKLVDKVIDFDLNFDYTYMIDDVQEDFEIPDVPPMSDTTDGG